VSLLFFVLDMFDLFGGRSSTGIDKGGTITHKITHHQINGACDVYHSFYASKPRHHKLHYWYLL